MNREGKAVVFSGLRPIGSGEGDSALLLVGRNSRRRGGGGRPECFFYR